MSNSALQAMDKSVTRVIPATMYESMKTKLANLSIRQSLCMMPHVFPNSNLAHMMDGDIWTDVKPPSQEQNASNLALMYEQAGRLFQSSSSMSDDIKTPVMKMCKEITSNMQDQIVECKAFIEKSLQTTMTTDEAWSILGFFENAKFTSQEFRSLLIDIVPESALAKTLNKCFAIVVNMQ
jgi:hypothetical protein